MRRLLSLSAVGLIAITCGPNTQSFAPACVTDANCAEGLVCFTDGCGDPTRGLAVEVTGGSTSGLFPQDFAVPELGATADFELKGPITLVGSFQRERTPTVDPTQRNIYSDEVLVRASGESVIIPGVSRTYQSRYSMTDRGTFSMNLGQGRYSVTAFPANVEVPPQTFNDVTAGPDGGSVLSFAFPSVEGTVTLSGRLVKKRGLSGEPDVHLTQAAMDLQAIDPVSGEPLSQRIETSTGRDGSRGDFILAMSPRARTLTAIELLATPREAAPPIDKPNLMLPSRRVTLSAPFPANLTIEIGDFGDPIPSVAATILGVDGNPLADATVIVEGRALGGGTFRSRPIITGQNGVAQVPVLAPQSSYTLTVFPQAGSRSAVTARSVEVELKPGESPRFSPSEIRCGERIIVSGIALLPDGSPAALLTVQAIETGSTTRPLALDDVRVQTDLEGKYELRLDPGNWRVEFIPAAELPQTSRLIAVSASAASDGGAFVGTQSFAPIKLPRGRKLTGLVTATLNRGPVPLVNAQVRFFRVTRIEGKPASILLGSGVTNGVGVYTLILPTRDQARAQ